MNNLNIQINIAIVVSAVMSIVWNNYKLYFFLVVLSVTIGMFGLNSIGSDIRLSQIIACLMLGRTFVLIKKRKKFSIK